MTPRTKTNYSDYQRRRFLLISYRMYPSETGNNLGRLGISFNKNLFYIWAVQSKFAPVNLVLSNAYHYNSERQSKRIPVKFKK